MTQGAGCCGWPFVEFRSRIRCSSPKCEVFMASLYVSNRSLTPHAATTFASVSTRGFRRPESARESATRSIFARRASSDTPPLASATLRRAFMSRRGSSSHSSIASSNGSSVKQVNDTARLNQPPPRLRWHRNVTIVRVPEGYDLKLTLDPPVGSNAFRHPDLVTLEVSRFSVA